MKTLLQLNNVNFTLPNGKRILSDITTDVCEGEFVVLVGSNGSGKSTLIKLINQQYYLREGKIQFNGSLLAKLGFKQRANEIITLTQFVKDSLFVDLTIAENARLISNIKSECELKNYLTHFNPKLAELLKSNVSDLSGGEQQQLTFALYLTKKPKLLLLDEHTSALDPKTAQKIMEMTNEYIRQNNLTCIMTTHNLDFASRYGDRLIAMKNGQLMQTKPSSEANKSAFLAECYA